MEDTSVTLNMTSQSDEKEYDHGFAEHLIQSATRILTSLGSTITKEHLWNILDLQGLTEHIPPVMIEEEARRSDEDRTEELTGTTMTHKHRGVLFVAHSLLSQLDPDITISHTDIMAQLRDDGVFARLRDRLLLPKNYTVVGIFTQNFGHTWAILVESPELPGNLTHEGIEYPRLEPRYVSVFNKETGKYDSHLVEIKVIAQRTIPVTGGVDWLLKAVQRGKAS